MDPAMIISTSSHNVKLTDDICAYVEKTLRSEFGRVADDVVSVDARLEAIHNVRDSSAMKAVVCVTLRSHRALVTEVQDGNLYRAIRRSAVDSARAIDRQVLHARQVTGQRVTDKIHAFGRYPAPTI
jgi:ribosome-associated translation inhibitor RaiA